MVVVKLRAFPLPCALLLVAVIPALSRTARAQTIVEYHRVGTTSGFPDDFTSFHSVQVVDDAPHHPGAPFVLASVEPNATPADRLVMIATDPLVTNVCCDTIADIEDPGEWTGGVQLNIQDILSVSFTERTPNGPDPEHAAIMNVEGVQTASAAVGNALTWGLFRLLEAGMKANETTPPPEPLLPLGTKYAGFTGVEINRSHNVLAGVHLDNLLLTKRALLLVDVQPSPEQIDRIRVVARKGGTIGGQTVDTVDLRPNEMALNDADQVLFTATVGGTSGIYLWQDGVATPVAQTGAPSPAPGENYGPLTFIALDLNDHGDVAFVVPLDGGFGRALVHGTPGSESVFVRAGDPVPGLSGRTLSGIGGSGNQPPVSLTNEGDLVWWGKWNEPSVGPVEGLFFNHHLLVQEKVTVDSAGWLITEIGKQNDFQSNLFDVGPSGQFLSFEAFAEGAQRMYRVDLGTYNTIPGCAGNPGTLVHTGASFPLVGATTSLVATGGGNGQLASLKFSLAPDANHPCGTVFPFGELLIDVAPANVVLTINQVSTGGPVTFSVPMPVDPMWVGVPSYLQVGFLGAAQPVTLTNALELIVGP